MPRSFMVVAAPPAAVGMGDSGMGDGAGTGVQMQEVDSIPSLHSDSLSFLSHQVAKQLQVVWQFCFLRKDLVVKTLSPFVFHALDLEST